MEDALWQLLGSLLEEAADRTSLLGALISTMARDPESVTGLLVRNTYRITPELAADAKRVYTLAIDAQQYDLALAATMTAARIYLRLGERYEGLRCYFNHCQLRYMAAGTLEEYSTIQQAIDGFIQKAKEIEASDLIFQGYQLSANCHFFSASLSQEREGKTNLLLNAFVDLLNAAEYKIEPSDDISFDQFVSLLATLIFEFVDTSGRFSLREAANQDYRLASLPHQLRHLLSDSETKEDSQKEQKDGTEGQEDTGSDQIPLEYAEAKAAVNTMFQQVAQMAERLISVDFTAHEGLAKSISEARSLAALSYAFGDVEIANTRLDIATDRAEELVEQLSNYDPWMDIVLQRYRGARRAGGAVTEFVKLRHMLRERAGKFRGLFHSRVGRLWAAQRLDFIYGELLRDDLQEENISTRDLFNSLEMAKARALLDQMCVEIKELPTEELNAQVMLMERKLLSFAPEPENPSDTTEQKLLGEEMRITTRLPIGSLFEPDDSNHWESLALIEELYRTHQAGFTGIQSLSQVEEIMQALQPDEVLIEYGIPFHGWHPSYELIIIVLTKDWLRGIYIPLDNIPGWKLAGALSSDGKQPVAISLLGNIVIQTRVAVQQQDEATAQEGLKVLYQLLIQSILDNNIQLQNRKCIIVPHGMLHQIPFVALLSDMGHYLIEDVPITIAPSASTWLKLREQSRPEVSSFLGFASPDLPYVQLPPLPYSEKELVRIRKSLASLRCTTYTHTEATEEAFVAQAEGMNILHLATHGDFPEQNAMDLHRILLAPTTVHDGRVDAEEIRSMHLQAARLVVLSICNGGLYRVGPGDEPYGLMSAFLIAGVENIIAPLWPLKDNMGHFFMIEFYKHLLKAGPAEALQQTCRVLIQDHAHIRDWAGIILLGTGKTWTETCD